MPVLQQWSEIESAQPDRSKPHWGRLWNVNLPAVEPSQETVDINHCRVDPTANIPEATIKDGLYRAQIDFHGRPRQSGTDIDQCFGGRLTISELCPGIQQPGVQQPSEPINRD